MPTFKMPTIEQVWQLIEQGNYAFSIDIKDAYLHIPMVKHHFFLYIFGQILLMEGFAIWAAHGPRIFISLTEPILIFWQCKGFNIISIYMIF